MRFAIKLLPVAALAALALTACENDSQRATHEPEGTGTVQSQKPAASVEAIRDDPGRYYGKKVGVVGEVDEVYADRAFEMDGAEWAFNDKITVLTRLPVHLGGAAITADDDVVVSGTVRPFVVADLEKEIGWTIPADLQAKLAKRPVIVADAITRTGGYGTWSATGNTQPVSTILGIVATMNPSALDGQKVDLGRERVQAVAGKGLWVGPSRMSQVFVLPSGDEKNVKAGDVVHVTGTLKKVPKDAGKEWNLPMAQACQLDENTVYVDGATITEVKGAGQMGNPPGTNPTQPGTNPPGGGAHPGTTPATPAQPGQKGGTPPMR